MKTDSLAKAITATRGLTTQQLQELRGHISRLLQMGPGPADRAVAHSDAPEELILIAEFCRDKGMPPVKITDMMTATQYGSFQRKVPAVRTFIAQVGDKTQQRALLRVALKQLHKDMMERRIAISYLSYLNEFHRIPGIINREFPGYAEAGFMQLIIRGEVSHVRKERSKRPVQRNGRAVKSK
jgi:hypothetical protein